MRLSETIEVFLLFQFAFFAYIKYTIHIFNDYGGAMNELSAELKKQLASGRRNETVPLIYRGLAEKIRSSNGAWQLPRIHCLASELQVSSQSVRKAYILLQRDGLVKKPVNGKLWKCLPVHESRKFGVILPEPFSNFIRLSNISYQYRIQMFSGLIDRAVELGHTVTPLLLPPPDAGDDEIEKMQKKLHGFDGIIHVGDRGAENDRPLQAVLNDPVIRQISFACEIRDHDMPAVLFDPRQAVESVIHILRSFGHFKVAVCFIDHPSKREKVVESFATLTTGKEVRECFAAACQENMEITYLPFNRVDNLKNSVVSKIRQIFSDSDHPTAVWCRTIELARVTISALNGIGLRCPEDVSVIACGDRLDAANISPALTSTRCQYYEMGRSVIDMLVKMQYNLLPPEERKKYISTILMERESVIECNSAVIPVI